MLTRTAIITYAFVLAALLALVVFFTDRGAFAWTLAGAVFAGVVGGDAYKRSKRSTRD